jgi:ATP-binding cassette subfamily B protein
VNHATVLAKRRAVGVTVRFLPWLDLLQPLALAVSLALGGYLVPSGDIALGVVVASTLLVACIFEPVALLGEMAHLVQSSAAAFAKVEGFLAERPVLQEADGAVESPTGAGRVQLTRVSLQYAPGGPYAVRDIDLDIEPGSRVALVGHSGAGKSTVASLIARLYDPTQGQVLLDGADLRSLRVAGMRRRVVLMVQEGFLFPGTVADNIALARPGTRRADVDRVCLELGVQERFDALPHGLDTQLGERGAGLSAGQRQLVALARALVAAPDVLVLDEASANLDPATDLLVEQALGRLMQGRTSIVIAHRVRTALRADRVVLLDAGRVAEDGAPDELLARGGSFGRWMAATEKAVAR